MNRQYLKKSALPSAQSPLQPLEEVSNAAERFKGLVKTNSAAKQDAEHFLTISQQYLRSLARPQAEQQCREHDSGGLVLDWLWSHVPPTRLQSLVDRTFADLLCRHLVLEGRELYLWQWTKIAAKQANAVDGAMPRWGKMIEWTDDLMAGLAQAHLALATDAKPGAALQCLFKAKRLFMDDAKLFNTVTLMKMRLASTDI